MIHRIPLTMAALLVATPLMAQAPAGMQMRVDRSTNAADPDDVPDVTITTMGDDFRVVTGPAVVLWDPENTASGEYTLSGRFTLEAPSNHVNYYGLVFGGRDLQGASQNYLYFLVAQNGSYIVKHRAGEATHDLQGRTPHEAVRTPGSDGRSVNDLEVRVRANEIQFAVNGTVVHTAPRSGMAARTDGIWGVRINHVIPGVVVEDLRVTQ